MHALLFPCFDLFVDRGYLSLFAEHVTQADRGCDFDFLHAGPHVPEPEIH